MTAAGPNDLARALRAFFADHLAGSAAPERQRLPAAANAGGDGNSALRRPWPVRRGAAPQHICCI